MRRELLAQPKFLVPLAFLLWLVVSLPLSVSQAGSVNDPACPTDMNGNGSALDEATAGVWGQPDDPYYEGGTTHLTAQDACYRVGDPNAPYAGSEWGATLVWGEWWRDKAEDCDLDTPESTYWSCSDSDKNWYLRLNRSERTAAGITSGEIKKLQRWSQCKAGQRDSSRWCNFLVETIPQGGNYGDPNPTDDNPQLPDPCLDKDWGGQTIAVGPCKGKNIQISFTGTKAKDNNHGWKEVHPARKEQWTDSNGRHTCSLYTADNDNCTGPTSA